MPHGTQPPWLVCVVPKLYRAQTIDLVGFERSFPAPSLLVRGFVSPDELITAAQGPPQFFPFCPVARPCLLSTAPDAKA